MKKIFRIFFLFIVFCTFSCREAPPETPQEEQSISREGELDDDGPMDVD